MRPTLLLAPRPVSPILLAAPAAATTPAAATPPAAGDGEEAEGGFPSTDQGKSAFLDKTHNLTDLYETITHFD